MSRPLHAHLVELAKEREDTITNVLRSLIRADMDKAELDARVIERLDAWMESHRQEAQAIARLEARTRKLKEGTPR
ncbi:MAG TPA: hypothetical protein VMV18_08505 [bacterium]|nr:hypothetical protein [bacterium]